MFTQLVVWLNTVANSLAGILLKPIAWMPGWLSVTLIGIVTGVLMLIVFKYTSNQRAVKHTRNQIKANLLALSLFKDDFRVSLRAQGRLLASAGRLLSLSLVPLLIMAVPMALLLGQLAMWYQARPLTAGTACLLASGRSQPPDGRIRGLTSPARPGRLPNEPPVGAGEESIVTVQLAEDASQAVRDIALVPSDSISVVTGPVRVPTKHMVCWKIQPHAAGVHQLQFSIGDDRYSKELAVGEQLMPVSVKRPGWNWADVLVHPREPPFAAESPVQSIEVAYPERPSWMSGTNSWLITWFVVSLLAAFAARPLLNVHL